MGIEPRIKTNSNRFFIGVDWRRFVVVFDFRPAHHQPASDTKKSAAHHVKARLRVQTDHRKLPANGFISRHRLGRRNGCQQKRRCVVDRGPPLTFSTLDPSRTIFIWRCASRSVSVGSLPTRLRNSSLTEPVSESARGPASVSRVRKSAADCHPRPE